MLKKITKGEWERSDRTITTKGGTYVGTATTQDNAKLMAASQKLLELIEQFYNENPELEAQVNSIFENL